MKDDSFAQWDILCYFLSPSNQLLEATLKIDFLDNMCKHFFNDFFKKEKEK